MQGASGTRTCLLALCVLLAAAVFPIACGDCGSPPPEVETLVQPEAVPAADDVPEAVEPVEVEAAPETPAPESTPEMTRIRPGRFTMGSPETEAGRMARERPHEVEVTRPYHIARHEVTRALWNRVMGHDSGRYPACGDNCPIGNVSWHDAIEFCNRLSEMEGLGLCYGGEGNDVRWNTDCTGYRLPTEAEWEYAARAETATAFASGDIAPAALSEFGSDLNLDRIGWYRGNAGVDYEGCRDLSPQGGPSCAGPHPVGRKQANAWGLFDMHGNVSEWVWDLYQAEYPAEPATDPLGPAEGAFRVFRGGGWMDAPRACRSAARTNYPPRARMEGLGFRVARNAGQ